MVTTVLQAPSTLVSATEAPARIGPNAVVQSMRALAELEPAAIVAAVRARAGLPSPLPPGMIPEAWFVRMVDAIRSELSPERAERVLERAGAYTAEYVAAHRIPAPVRWVLAVLPARAATALLLRAFRRHAWTFAGAGRFTTAGEHPATLVLAGAPTCRDRQRGDAMGGTYYAAAFEGLLRLASPRVRVREVACEATGAPCCRFEITLHAAEPT